MNKDNQVISEEIITWDTAKLAEEKGFTNKVVGRKDTQVSRNYYNRKGELNGDVTDLIKAVVKKTSLEKYKPVPAPTQSLLQTWLRRVHNVIINVGYHEFGVKQDNGWYYSIGKSNGGAWINGKSETYEESLELGLIDGLNLIK